MSKFLLNLLVQISKAFVYSKIQILFGNNSHQLSAQPRPIPFFSFFQPVDFPSPPHWAMTSRPAQPTITAQPATGHLLPPTPKPSTTSPPAGLVPPPQSPRRLHRKRKMAASISPSFPPINRCHSRPLQSRKPVPSTPPLKLLQSGHSRRSALPRLAFAL
jgi:hypothetical protein